MLATFDDQPLEGGYFINVRTGERQRIIYTEGET